MRRGLGIDLACRNWEELGSALVEFSEREWRRIRLGICAWPKKQTLSPESLADYLSHFVREHELHLVILDGPQAWKDPESRTPHSRLAERELNTPGKTGVWGQAKPRSYLPFILFSISVFERLVQEHGFLIFNYPRAVEPQASPWLAECFPTGSWREIGVAPLPAKRKVKGPALRKWLRLLRDHFHLPPPTGELTHDNLQALVGALAGAAALSGPAQLCAYGRPVFQGLAPVPHYVEGFILTAK